MGDYVREWQVYGNRVLSGSIKVEGAKNSLVAILPAAVLTKSIVELDNVTPIKDTYVLIEILKNLNVRVIYDNKSKMIIDSRYVKNVPLIDENMQKLRASYYFMGVLMSLYKKSTILGPGGCEFAARPINFHLDAFQKIGISYTYDGKVYNLKKNEKRNVTITFKKISVGATINLILACCRKKGITKLINVANEPEVDDLIDFLNSCGGNIKRQDNQIIIIGKNKLHGCKHSIIQDRIEAGTYLILGACVGKHLQIEYKNSRHLTTLIELLRNCGVDINVNDDCIEVSMVNEISDSFVECDVYPKIPTDLQQPLSILFTKTKKESILKDNVYPSRYTQIDDLTKMGFKMSVEGDFLRVCKSNKIKGKNITCRDLRGGASLIIAALIGDGVSIIRDVYHIERGYYDILNKLRKVGAIAYEKN